MSYTKYTDDDLRAWAGQAMFRGGDFVKSFGEALLRADQANFEILRPVAERLIAKYPKYLAWARAGTI